MSEGPGGPQGATAGGTLAMRMLSQQAMVASQMKRAANDKAIAQMLAAKKSGPPAARLGDEIQHKSFLGALAGAVLGAIVTIAEGCLIMAACATGPYALVLVPALMYASYKASDYVEEKQNQLESWINSFCDTDGAINTGSENVNINGKPAARAAVTLPPPPPPGAIPEIPQGEPSWGDIATDLLESAAEKAVPLAKAWGNAVITLTESNAGFMDRVSAGASLLFPAGPVLMEFATMVGGRGEIKKDVDFPEAGEDTALCDKENKPPRIPVLLKEGQYDAAQKLLATLPANEMLEERYAVSVATRNKAEALRLARLLYQQEPANLTRLDQLTWQLMQNEQSREAADLLLQRYPFQGDARVSQTLMARLASLLESHPYLATPAKVAILSKPLPLAEQRQWQSQLPGIADNCPAIVRLLGDMSPSYDAAAWNRLAKCYRDTLPGVALYAWLQAEQRQPNAWQHRAVAYQAYQVEDYATALAAWQKISLHDMSNEDLLAAANTAQAAGNGAARDRWLQQAEKRGLGSNALYWWLHAQRYIPGQPELTLNDLTRSINIAPSANAYVARATIYRQRHNVPAAVSDLRAALELEPNNSNTQAALGYALWDSGDIAQSREMLEQAHKGLPDDPALIRQLAYVNQRLDDMPATQHYARLVIDDIDNQALITPLTPEQNQQRFNFRRLHEEVGRRWTFSFDSSIGLRSGAMSTANNNVGGAAPGKSYRSYGQLEAEYRIGRNMLLEGDLLSVYSRVFADTGENGVMMPVKNPMSGTGLRWKPLRDQIFFLAVEQQLPLNGQNGASDTMLRASASFFNGGKYSDEWHPNGSGWFAQNLYLDAAQYIRQDIQAWTADYRVSWHQKVANGQTIEPYAHVQDNGYRDKGTQGAQLGGVGVRWNIWTGETHYDAWPHKVSLGVEYQHTFKAINQRNGERNNAFLTIGVHW
ncbi:phage receptor [Escherichia coli]|nr:phage receptor [Escherichia coli]EFP2072318.1 phage receptor [Escherichia coli]MHP41888.1 phage receptor [Escherichia coli]